jgi:hypothetical protein
VVVFNATPTETVQHVDQLSSAELRPHPDLLASVDLSLRTASATAGSLTVPARSVAVFVAEAH